MADEDRPLTEKELEEKEEARLSRLAAGSRQKMNIKNILNPNLKEIRKGAHGHGHGGSAHPQTSPAASPSHPSTSTHSTNPVSPRRAQSTTQYSAPSSPASSPASQPSADLRRAPSVGGNVPKWKQLQLEQEERERQRAEAERKAKEEAAKAIEQRVAVVGLSTDIVDSEVPTFVAAHETRGTYDPNAAPDVISPRINHYSAEPEELPGTSHGHTYGSGSAQAPQPAAVHTPAPVQVAATSGGVKPKFCPFCGTPTREEGKFCISCGKEVPLVPPPSTPAPAPSAAPAPVSYAPAPVKHTPVAAPQSTGIGFVSNATGNYPAYQVGELRPQDNGNLLPISHLGCPPSALALRLKNNGLVVEFSRVGGTGSDSKREVQNFNLPYQVTPQTVRATYRPSQNQGTLEIYLGKNATTGQGTTIVGEHTITRFTVRGDPNSSLPRVTVGIEQGSDFYKFVPGQPSRFDTDFQVVVNGSNLEFRTSHSFPDGDAIKSVSGKQSVNLPKAPTLEQLETEDLPSGAKAILIWHAPKVAAAAPASVPDTALNISVQ